MNQLKLLTSLIIVVFTTNLHSQNLDSTIWAITDTNEIFQYYHFYYQDTLWRSDSLNFTTIVTKYEDKGSQVNYYPGGPCTDTGKYNYVIQNDTAKFSPITDLCPDRSRFYLYNYHLKYNPYVGVKDREINRKIKVYPNPMKNTLMVEGLSHDADGIFNIYDKLGRIVLTGNIEQKRTEIETSKISPGLYFLRIEGVAETFKLVK